MKLDMFVREKYFSCTCIFERCSLHWAAKSPVQAWGCGTPTLLAPRAWLSIGFLPASAVIASTLARLTTGLILWCYARVKASLVRISTGLAILLDYLVQLTCCSHCSGSLYCTNNLRSTN